jgi:hypothetical protein
MQILCLENFETALYLEHLAKIPPFKAAHDHFPAGNPPSAKNLHYLLHCKKTFMRKFYQHFLPVKPFGRVKTLCLSLLMTSLIASTEAGAQAGNALSYDGVDDFTTLPAGIVQGLTSSFTIEFWVYWRGGAQWQRVFDFGTAGNNFIMFTPKGNLNPAPDGSRFAIERASDGLTRVIDGPVLPTNTWVHVAITVDASDVGKVYFNGTQVATATIDINPSELGNTTNDWLGKSQYAGSPYFDPYFNGIIEEFRISNVVRYTTNFTPVTGAAGQFTTDANTVALYHFNEGTGQTTADASGNFGVGYLGSDATVESSDPTWITNSILPVKISSFTVNVNKSVKAVDVKWTASADGPTDFIVERSINGIQFTPVGTISAANSLGLQNFSFRDSHPLAGRSYYRLKAVESGIAPVYSRIAPASLGEGNEILVYPNPVRGRTITIELAQPYTGPVEISLVNTAGAVVLRQKGTANNQIEFNLQRTGNIPAGNYFIRVITNDSRQSAMILCQ